MTGSQFQASSSDDAPPISAGHFILAVSVMLLASSELFRIFVSDVATSIVSRIAFVALCFGLIPWFSVREWVMAGLAASLAVGLLVKDETSGLFFALDRAAFFAAFIYLVTLLKEAAQRSGSVLEFGVFLTQQPQGRRYYSISIGGHIMGVLLNFGAVSLLTPLIQRGARQSAKLHPNGPGADQLERQQISALLRGFSWMILWAPTALTQAVLFTSFPAAQANKVIPLGLGASVVMIVIGRLMDRAAAQTQKHPPVTLAPSVPQSALRRLGLICAVLITLTFGLSSLAQVSAAIALMPVAPLVMAIWIFAQQGPARFGHALRRSLGLFHDIFFRGTTGPARSAFILGAAGFIGQAAAELAPVAAFAAWLDPGAIPAFLFLAALPVLITLGGQFALSPIMVVVFLSAVINELPSLPADPNLIVFALGAGWALSMTASPNASATLLISAISKIAPTTLTWRWNGRYALVCYLIFVASFAALTALT